MAVLFVIKKVVSALAGPVGIPLVLWAVGIFLLGRKTKSRSGFVLILGGGILLLVLSFPLTAYLLMRPLEVAAGPYAEPTKLSSLGIHYIVALGGGSGKDNLSPADRAGSGLFRVMEGVRLWRRIPDAVLVLSGMGFPLGWTSRESMAALPTELGVPRKSLILEARAWDTEDEASLFAKVVGNKPFALVTSAYHIPRAIKLFRSLGLKPVAAPCEFSAIKPPPFYQWFLPDADALKKTQTAMHEYLGIVWLMIKAVIQPRLSPSANKYSSDNCYGHDLTAKGSNNVREDSEGELPTFTVIG